jgi:hypothetical protein
MTPNWPKKRISDLGAGRSVGQAWPISTEMIAMPRSTSRLARLLSRDVGFDIRAATTLFHRSSGATLEGGNAVLMTLPVSKLRDQAGQASPAGTNAWDTLGGPKVLGDVDVCSGAVVAI